MDAIRVVVTGAGSAVGQAIVKALWLSELPVHVICTDISNLNAGLYRADESLILPPVEAEGALEKILAALRPIAPDAVMIGSEFDLLFFSENREVIEEDLGCPVIVSPRETVTIAEDKWLTAEFLRQQGFPYVAAVIPKNPGEARAWAENSGYPLILKSRVGTSSRNVHLLQGEEDLRYWLPRTDRPMLQVLAGPVELGLGCEYTCSVFRCADDRLLGPFVARRTLRGGASWITEVVSEPAIDDFMIEIGRRLPSTGSLNVQLMMDGSEPRPFEINARFSGTTAIRAHFGFNEPDMALRSYVLGEKLSSPEIGRGVVLRFLEELFIDGLCAAEIAEPIPRGLVHRWF